MFISDLQQVCGFLRVLKVSWTIKLKYCLKVALKTVALIITLILEYFNAVSIWRPLWLQY